MEYPRSLCALDLVVLPLPCGFSRVSIHASQDSAESQDRPEQPCLHLFAGVQCVPLQSTTRSMLLRLPSAGRVCVCGSSLSTPRAFAAPRTCGLETTGGLARETDPILSLPFHWSAPTGVGRTNVGKPRSSGSFGSRDTHVTVVNAHHRKVMGGRIHRGSGGDVAKTCVRVARGRRGTVTSRFRGGKRSGTRGK